MACEVTIGEIEFEIRQELLDVGDTSPHDGSIFENYTQTNPDNISKELKARLNALSVEYDAATYGKIFTTEKSEFGTRIFVHPPQALADAMTLQNIKDEMDKDPRYKQEKRLYGSPINTNTKRPATDNYIEYTRYKKAQLAKTESIIHRLNLDKKNPKKDLPGILSELKDLYKLEAALKQDIETLEKNKVEYMFHGIESEIKELQLALDNIDSVSDIHSVEAIVDRIDFLHKLVKGRDLKGNESDIAHIRELKDPNFEKLSDSIDELADNYRTSMKKIADKIVKEDISYAMNVEANINLTPEQLEGMFHAKDDINWLEKTFLGISNSGTNDTILPQILQSFLKTKVSKRQAEVKRYQDRLSRAIRSVTGDNFDFIFETTSKGTKTGNIINNTTPLWRTAFTEFLNISNNETITEAEKHGRRIHWLRNNATVIDIRKLKVVQAQYGDIYKEHFKFSDTIMDAYEQELKDTLGPLYEDEIAHVLNNLALFQEKQETLLESTDNAYRFKNVAKISPWDFIEHYHSSHAREGVSYNAGGVNTEQVFPDIRLTRFIPAQEVYANAFDEHGEVFKDSGYYSKTFNEEIRNDPAKLEYWKVIKEIYQDYINPTYGTEYMSDMSYAKFEADFTETITQAKGIQKGSSLFNKAKHSFKELFYERGHTREEVNKVAKTYGDRASSIAKQITSVLKYKTEEQLKAIAKQEGIDTVGLDKARLLKEISLRQSIKGFSTDINKVTGALLDMVAMQKGKEDTLPVANLLLNAHKISNPERRKSIERMEHFVDRVVKNKQEKYRGTTGFLGRNIGDKTWLSKFLETLGEIPLIGRFLNRETLYLLDENEKQLLEYLKEIKDTGPTEGHFKFKTKDGIETFDKVGNIKGDKGTTYWKGIEGQKEPINLTEEEYLAAFRENIDVKIQEIGLDLSAAGVIQGMLKMIIFKGLALNPISGIFNRIEGKNSALIMDKTGKYWTKGNINEANTFMMFSNFMKILPERLKPAQLKKIQELEKFQIFLNNVDLIQDRKNELERQAEKSEASSRYAEKYTNVFQFAVDNPEFKNQGSIALSILMDTKIEDKDGNLVPIFDGKEFAVYDTLDGQLVLKPEFRHSQSNIDNWENFEINERNAKDNQFFATKNKIEAVISRSQGNYDNLDVIDGTRNIWGRALTMFMKWMPEHFMQRFGSGKGVDIYTGDTKLKGRYRSLWENHPALFTTGVSALFIGFGITPVSALVGLGFTGFVAAKYFKDVYGKKAIKREIDTTQELIAFTKSVLIETLNYPLELFNSPKTFNNKAYDKLEGKNLSKEEIGNLTAVAKEIGIKLTMVAFMLLLKKATWDDEDDKDSDQRQLHNFIDNQLNRNITTLSNWTNPNALITDVQRLAFLRYLGDISNFLYEVGKMDDGDKIQKYALKSSPIPRLLYKGSMPWHDEKEYNNTQWQDRFIKNINSDGEWEAEQQYRDIRATAREEFRNKHLDNGLTRKPLKDAVNADMKKAFPRKKKGESYSSILKRIEQGK